MIRDLHELQPAVYETIERYLVELEAGFCEVPPELALEALSDVREHLLERLDASSSIDEARALLADFGEPDEYAQRLCVEISAMPEDARSAETGADMARPAGTFLGMPYDLKAPTSANLQSRMWNPNDPRIFTPRLLGLGWTINFAAIAVKTGLMRPDDEDVPFAAVPESALWAALFVPIVVCGVVVIACAVSWSSLPDQLPVHWGFSGQPDDYASASTVLWPLIVMAVIPTGYALWVFAKGRTKTTRAVVVAFTTIFVTLSASLVGAALAGGNGVTLGWAWPWMVLLAAFGVPFVMLFALSRIGHAHEVRADLEKSVGQTKGRD